MMRRVALLTSVLLVTVVAWCATARVAWLAHSIVDELDRAQSLADLAPRPQATIVYDRHDRPAFTFFIEQRTDVPLERVSQHMIDALLSVEDRRFFSHHGMDPHSHRRRGVAKLSRRTHRGGRQHDHPAAGAGIALVGADLRSEDSRDSRSRRKSNSATRNRRSCSSTSTRSTSATATTASRPRRGATSAKPPRISSRHEAALLAALVRSPSSDAPSVGPARALKRRNLVLRLMQRQRVSLGSGDLRHGERGAHPGRKHRADSTAGIVAANGPTAGLYFQEEVRRQLFAHVRCRRRCCAAACASTRPTIRELQRDAERAVSARIAEIAEDRAPPRTICREALSRWIPQTGDVHALVGGRDFGASSFNRATQAQRQAGSAFKPIIYAAALERGYSPGTLLRDLDAPIEAGHEDVAAGRRARAVRNTRCGAR